MISTCSLVSLSCRRSPKLLREKVSNAASLARGPALAAARHANSFSMMASVSLINFIAWLDQVFCFRGAPRVGQGFCRIRCIGDVAEGALAFPDLGKAVGRWRIVDFARNLSQFIANSRKSLIRYQWLGVSRGCQHIRSSDGGTAPCSGLARSQLEILVDIIPARANLTCHQLQVRPRGPSCRLFFAHHLCHGSLGQGLLIRLHPDESLRSIDRTSLCIGA